VRVLTPHRARSPDPDDPIDPLAVRAIVVSRFGGPEVLEPTEVDEPRATAGEVVVAHEFVGVNFVDTQHRAGAPYPVELPLIVGIEAAGTVVAVGDEVGDVAVGERVAYGGPMPGVYAERAAVPADQLVSVPDDVGLDVAAGALLQGWTAHMLAEHAEAYRRMPWATDEAPTVVVYAAAGGTGSLLVQMLVATGARVLGIASGPAKCDTVRAFGAEAIDRRRDDPVEAVREAVGTGADVVIEGIGGPTFDQARRMLHARGHLVSFGQSAGPAPPIDPALLSGISAAGGPGSLSLTWPTLNNHNATAGRRRQRAADVFSMIGDGRVQLRIDAVLPLAEAAEAHRRLEAGSTIGKLLLEV
jgi:NADPH:quinone reductase